MILANIPVYNLCAYCSVLDSELKNRLQSCFGLIRVIWTKPGSVVIQTRVGGFSTVKSYPWEHYSKLLPMKMSTNLNESVQLFLWNVAVQRFNWSAGIIMQSLSQEMCGYQHAFIFTSDAWFPWQWSVMLYIAGTTLHQLTQMQFEGIFQCWRCVVLLNINKGRKKGTVNCALWRWSNVFKWPSPSLIWSKRNL